MKRVECPRWLMEEIVSKMSETIYLLERPLMVRAACYEHHEAIKFYADIYLPFYVIAIDGVAGDKEIEDIKIHVERACICDCGG